MFLEKVRKSFSCYERFFQKVSASHVSCVKKTCRNDSDLNLFLFVNISINHESTASELRR